MRLIPVLALLAACGADSFQAPEAAALPAASAAVDVAPPPGVPLALEVGDVIPGEVTTLRATDADPDERVFFALSTRGTGSGPCPAALEGLCLDLLPPVKLLGSVNANGAGTARFDLPVPANAPLGAEVAFQAVAKRGVDSVKSPAVTRTVIEGTVPWSNEAVILDGDTSEYLADESFATTSGGSTQTYITWDSTDLYVAFDHPDVAGTDLHWVTIYIGTGAPGANLGVPHNTQQPILPFDATHLVRWKGDNSYNSLEWWDGANWQGIPNYLGTNGSAVVESDGNQMVEFKLPRSLFATDTLYLHTAWVYEGAGFESTYAGTPADSFVDGYDPDFTASLFIDMSSPLSPVAQNP